MTTKKTVDKSEIEVKQKPTVVLCIPGDSWSYRFMESLMNLIGYFNTNDISYTYAMAKGSNVYVVRDCLIHGSAARGQYQVPWDGKVPYTHMLWIDSDMVFNPATIGKLLADDKDIVSGTAMLDGGTDFAFGYIPGNFMDRGIVTRENKDTIRTLEVDEHGLIEVDFVGMAFILIKKGVFEKMVYPYFYKQSKPVNGIESILSEDLAFCLKAREAGFSIYVDLNVRIGHEKPYTWTYTG